MREYGVVFFAAAVMLTVCAVSAIFIHRKKTKRTLMRMSEMLTAAIGGYFHEMTFDESLMSAVETQMAHYLSASSVSAQNLAAEKDKIKELLADISHQTKTPIANIMLYAQLLREQNLPDASISCVSALNMQAETLSFLIDTLVKTSRLEAGVLKLYPKNTAIQPMLDAVLCQIIPKVREKHIAVNCEATEIAACFDHKWTTEALYNIVDNAIKYTPAGGTVEILTRSYDLFCRIDIVDTGMGIAEAEQPKIFGRFYRAADAQDIEGVGIGLYLSRQIVAEEGGYIKVKSALGTGTTFSVFLPVKS